MSSTKRASEPAYQRNALAPGLLAAVVLMAGLLLIGNEWFTAIRYVVAILALIIAWFAVQARQWWWLLAFIPIAVLWNPIYPFDFGGTPWLAAQVFGAGVFVIAGILIKTRRE
ncbi:MAG TPA: DUF6804 family protein [Microbacteriaceae bacterium]|nr:DUF6804 family protein [Microbacteriaceae bacterium]